MIYVDHTVHTEGSHIEITPHDHYIIFWKMLHTKQAMLPISTLDGHEWNFPNGKTVKTIRFGYAEADQPMTATEKPRCNEVNS